jgi:hypothetical protein
MLADAMLAEEGRASRYSTLLHAWPARLANDVRLAPGRSVTPDFAAHAGGLLAPLGQPHKIYDGEPCALSQEPAAEGGLRAHDRHLITTFRSAHCYC